MSAVVHLVENIVSTVVHTVTSVLEVVWADVLLPVLKEIAALFGIKDKDVIHTNINSQRIIADDKVVQDTITKLALRHQASPNNSVISQLSMLTSGSRGKYHNYFEEGKNNYIDGLPTTQIKTTYADRPKIKKVIDLVYSINCTLSYADIHIPTKYEYTKFTLQENTNYNYKPWNNTLTYNGTYGVQTYILDTTDYNYKNNNYDISISAHETQTTQDSTVTVITISAGNDSNHDTKTTDVYSRVLVTGAISGVISDVSTKDSETSVQITKGSESNSKTEVINSTIYAYNVVYDTQTFTIASYLPNLDYVVKYYTTSNTEWKYWIYDESTGTYPSLAYEFNVLTNLDMLPVITVRNNFINSNADKKSVRYKDSQRMMKILGLDLNTFTDEIDKNPDIANVADVFVHFGISLNETSEVASKLFFDMFDTIQPNSANGSKYSITFKEGPMNMAIAWNDMTSTIHNGIIGKLEYADHSVSGDTLTIRKQTGPEQYTEIIMYNMSNVTFIDRQGLWGTVNTHITDSNFFLPVSQYHISKYSGLEQMELMMLSLRTTQYAAVIQHIKWYQTGIFAVFLQLLAVVIVIVGCVYSACSASTLAISLLTMVATSLALKWVFEHTHNPWLRGLAVVVAAVISGNFNGFSDVGMLAQASTLTTMVSEFVSIYTTDQMYKLQHKKTAFDSELDRRIKSLKEKQRELYAEAKIGLKYVTKLATLNNPIQYFKTTSVSYMMYIARDVQYDFGMLYDYDIMVKDFYNQKLSLS